LILKNSINFELKASVVEELQVFSKLLKKDPNTILNEALEQYLENEQKKLLEKNINDENAMTNLDFDEFWDGMDI
jgi:predicted transcriptional regulator